MGGTVSIVTKFSINSPEVTKARVGKFQTLVKSVTRVNGSKYQPGFWRGDMYEIETTDGVYINDGVRNNTNDFTRNVNKCVEVSTNKNKPDITWIWINFIHVTPKAQSETEPEFVKLENALSGKIPAKHCCVYKIEIGAEVYVGFTSGDPQKRIDKHIEQSKNNAMQEVNKALRKWGYQHTWEIIGEYENEILALLAEKIQIVKLNATLNKSDGGEGDDFNIVEQQCKIGNDKTESVFYVHDKHGLLKE